MPDLSISEFIARMASAFVAEKALGIDAVIQLKLNGSQPGECFITLKDGQCTLSPGRAETPRLTATVDGADLIRIFSGELDGMQAYMQGKVRLVGDMNLALKLTSLFRMQ